MRWPSTEARGKQRRATRRSAIPAPQCLPGAATIEAERIYILFQCVPCQRQVDSARPDPGVRSALHSARSNSVVGDESLAEGHSCHLMIKLHAFGEKNVIIIIIIMIVVCWWCVFARCILIGHYCTLLSSDESQGVVPCMTDPARYNACQNTCCRETSESSISLFNLAVVSHCKCEAAGEMIGRIIGAKGPTYIQGLLPLRP